MANYDKKLTKTITLDDGTILVGEVRYFGKGYKAKMHSPFEAYLSFDYYFQDDVPARYFDPETEERNPLWLPETELVNIRKCLHEAMIRAWESLGEKQAKAKRIKDKWESFELNHAPGIAKPFLEEYKSVRKEESELKALRRAFRKKAREEGDEAAQELKREYDQRFLHFKRVIKGGFRMRFIREVDASLKELGFPYGISVCEKGRDIVLNLLKKEVEKKG
jgi:hypothetical protein